MIKRPRDPAQLAKLIIDIASGEIDDGKNDGAKKHPSKTQKTSKKSSKTSNHLEK